MPKPPDTHCQICARPIQSKTGVIAHHGYKRPGNGWQTASCYGARHLPYEVSCDAIAGALTLIRSFIETMTAKIAAFQSNPPAVLIWTRGTWTITKTEVERPEDFKIDGYPSGRIGAYDTLFHAELSEMKSKLRHAELDETFLMERLINWKPAEVIAEAV